VTQPAKYSGGESRASIYPIETCPKCEGTGRNEKATSEMYQRDPSASGYVRCTLCNGNGVY